MRSLPIVSPICSLLVLCFHLWAPSAVSAKGSSNPFIAIHAEDGQIEGRVVEAGTGDPLPGANVVIKGTVVGAATDLDGSFRIPSVDPGEVTLRVSFLGYVTQEVVVEVAGNGVTRTVIEMSPMVLEGEAIEVTAQAQGQREAINRQISSDTAINVVSAKKIQELPESNAAEAVGRLPGVTLQREGGEGTKVVIRGLSPRYSKVQMEGVSLSSTDPGDRSTDLSMISPYMLDGIEVTKAARADQEADQLGGTVNFRLQKAPEKATFNAIVQSGYNRLRSSYDDYKLVVSGSNRFLNNKLGVFANVDYDRVNRSENSISNGFVIRGDTLAIASSTSFMDIEREKNRFGGSLVLDLDLENTSIKVFSIYNRVNEEETRFQEIYNAAARTHRLWLDNAEDELAMFTTSATFEHQMRGVQFSGGASFNSSRRTVPNGIQMNVQENNAFPNNFNYTRPVDLTTHDGNGILIEPEANLGFLHPEQFATVARNNDDATFVEWIYAYDNETYESQFGADLNAQYEVRLGSNVAVTLKSGWQIKRQDREFDNNRYGHPMWWTAQDIVRETWAPLLAESPFLEDYVTTNQNFPFEPFLDMSYDSSEFFDGQLQRKLDADMVRTFIDMIPKGDGGVPTGLTKDWPNSDLGDYDGDEQYRALYFMPTIRMGKRVTLISGVRHEKNRTEYTGRTALGVGQWDDPLVNQENTHVRENSFLLPMVHARFNLTSWMDIRASYTETLSRPSYNLIVPSWQLINPRAFNWNNPDLEPLESTNWDASLSVYRPKLGLISIGGFRKNISNFAFRQATYVVEEDQLLDVYPEDLRLGATVTGVINNPNDATLNGLEMEWQSNFWFLPGALSGIVFGVNYTYTDSELVYPLVRAAFRVIPPGIRILDGGEDASYSDRLIDQPNHALNIVLGIDYRGFSARGSMRRKSGVFTASNFFPELRQDSDTLTLVDVSLSQKLPVDGMNLFLNLANVSESIDRVLNRGTGWSASEQFFGMTGQMGLRYRR